MDKFVSINDDKQIKRKYYFAHATANVVVQKKNTKKKGEKGQKLSK